LICASIMSKKIAEGIDALVLDVKTGSGAFMQKEEDALRLAKAMVETGQRMGKKCVALLTDMGQPLGRMAGHSSEVLEAIDILKGRGPKDLRQLSVELSAWMFFLGERTPSVNDGRRLAEAMIASGQALEKFRECIALQGGDERITDDPSLLPQARSRTDVTSVSSGYIVDTHCSDFGIALAMLGGGREKKEDAVDHGVSLEFHKRIGDGVSTGEKLVTIHYNSNTRLDEAMQMIAESFVIGETAPLARPLIRQVLGG
jgi:pyrimidine-nucleoside phosphorylase